MTAQTMEEGVRALNTYIYRLTLMPAYHDYSGWDEKAQGAVQEHAQYLKRGVDDGTVLIIGRTDEDLKDNYGLVVLKAPDLEAARAFMAQDPAVSQGIMTARVDAFKLLMVADAAKDWNVW